MRPGEPTEEDYGTMPVKTLNSIFVGGRVHTTETNLVDNEGQVHSAGIVYEHVDKKLILGTTVQVFLLQTIDTAIPTR